MINGRKGKEGDKLTITFTFTIAEVQKAGLTDRFIRTWQSKRPSDYLKFLAILMEQQVNQQKSGFEKLYEEMLRNAANQANGTAQQQAQQAWQGDFRFNFGFDPAAEAAAREALEDPPWCKVLGLPKTATKEEIKAKYRELAKVHHPDAGGNATKFQEIKNAYEEAIS